MIHLRGRLTSPDPYKFPAGHVQTVQSRIFLKDGAGNGHRMTPPAPPSLRGGVGWGQRRRVGDPLHGQGCLAPQVLSTRAPLRHAKRALALELRDFFFRSRSPGTRSRLHPGVPRAFGDRRALGRAADPPWSNARRAPRGPHATGWTFLRGPCPGPGLSGPKLPNCWDACHICGRTTPRPSPVRALPSPAPPPLSLGRSALRGRVPRGVRGAGCAVVCGAPAGGSAC